MAYEKRTYDESVLLAEGARVSGDVTLGREVNIWYNAVLRGDDGAIVVGEGTNIQDCAVLHEETTVGRGCTIGHGAIVHGCTVGDNTLVGIAKGSRLQGAVYQITNMSGQVVATIYGDSYGEAHSGALGLGTYYVQQIQAPAGYMLNSQRVTINVTSVNDDIKITVYNKSGNFKTTVSAHGPRTVAPNNQAKFYWTNVSNASTTTVSNFFLHVKVPTDGARAGTFYTGTWTGTATTFRVEYKTNMSDYRVLSTGLNSKSQYSFDMSSIALGLASGEYVTDIRMVFDRASAGMKESMAPSLYVTVLPNIMNGYQLINRAETGCQGEASTSVSGSGFNANTGLNGIAGGWTGATAQSTTVVTGPVYVPYPLPSTLPKTGY